MSFQQLLREAAHAAGTAVDKDPWEPTLRKLKGRVGSVASSASRPMTCSMRSKCRCGNGQAGRCACQASCVGWAGLTSVHTV